MYALAHEKLLINRSVPRIALLGLFYAIFTLILTISACITISA